MRTNVLSPAPKTHGDATASRITPEQELRRSVMACMLWENNFYESGVDQAERIRLLVDKVKPETVAAIAREARTDMHLRHVPLWLMVQLARRKTLKADDLHAVIQRPDELTEFVSLYWKGGKVPLSYQVKKGLGRAFGRFNEYSLAKYNGGSGPVKLRDVLRLCHAKPANSEQSALWKRLVNGDLATPDTWEVELSKGNGKKESWMRLLQEGKLGTFALIRNMRNMVEAKVPDILIRTALADAAFKMGQPGHENRILPFRFLAAAKAAPRFESEVEALLLRSLTLTPRLPGKTVVVVDVSGSMYGLPVSAKSDMTRADAACALAAIARESCEHAVIYATAGSDGTRVHQTKEVPNRRGIALAHAIHEMSVPLGEGGIFLKQVMDFIGPLNPDADRVIVVTDEQDCDRGSTGDPAKAKLFAKRHYMINVNGYKNGIGYGAWTKIDGWSEAVMEYIRRSELN